MLWKPVLIGLLALQLGCTSAPTSPSSTADSTPAYVLFVGNSFTYYNDSLHNHLRQLMRAAGIENRGRIRIMTISGSHLAEHHGLPGMLASEDWDVVVLQGHSLEAYDPDRRERFFAAVRQHVASIRARGAEPLLFMTWAYKGRPDMIEVISRSYHQIGRETGARVVPVGQAFARVAQSHPGITLIHDDLRHPTVEGTYLAASVFLGALYGTSAQGLRYTAGLDPATVRVLQEAAWAVVQQTRQGTG